MSGGIRIGWWSRWRHWGNNNKRQSLRGARLVVRRGNLVVDGLVNGIRSLRINQGSSGRQATKPARLLSAGATPLHPVACERQGFAG